MASDVRAGSSVREARSGAVAAPERANTSIWRAVSGAADPETTSSVSTAARASIGGVRRAGRFVRRSPKPCANPCDESTTTGSSPFAVPQIASATSRQSSSFSPSKTIGPGTRARSRAIVFALQLLPRRT